MSKRCSLFKSICSNEVFLMKLGVFDSGLGGILISKAIRAAFPEIDMVYLGDTLHVPYGNRSETAIFQYTKACMDYLFDQGCAVIIVACNTASASALRRLQQEYLPMHYPERRILGVVVPTIEEAVESGYKNIGVIGTNYTVNSAIYKNELQKIDPSIAIHQACTPLLVPLMENGGEAWIDDVLESYLAPLSKAGIEALLLGCTHYVHLKKRIRALYGFDVLSQDEIIPEKLIKYFKNHPELFDKIDRHGNSIFMATDITPSYAQNASLLYGHLIQLQQVEIHG